MGTAFVPRASAQAQRAGFLVVVGLHALIGLALLHGLARTLITSLNPPPVTLVQPTPKVADDPPPLPKPKSPTLPPTVVAELPPVPEPQRPTTEPTITRSADPTPSSSGAAGGEPAGMQVPQPPSQPAPRVVAVRPAIGDVQACAPTGDDYPVGARRAEATGTTRLRFAVGANGALLRSEVVRSAGPTREHKQLDRIAESKLGGCRFTPGVDESGHAIGGTFEVDYVWRLDN